LQLFRLKGAQRKLKLDIQKIEKSKLSEDIRKKYQTSDLVTHLQNINFDQSYSLIPFESPQTIDNDSSFLHSSTDPLHSSHYFSNSNMHQAGMFDQVNGQAHESNMTSFSFGCKENFNNKYGDKDMMIDDSFIVNCARRTSVISFAPQLAPTPKLYMNTTHNSLDVKPEIKNPQFSQALEPMNTQDCVPMLSNNSPMKSQTNDAVMHPFSKKHDFENSILPPDEPSKYFQQWLNANRFDGIMQKLLNYATNDFLRLSKNDLIIITGNTAEAIRCYNLAHNVQIIPKLSIFLKFTTADYFCAIYFDLLTPADFIAKINKTYRDFLTDNSGRQLIGKDLTNSHDFSNQTGILQPWNEYEYNVLLRQNNILIRISDDLVKNLKMDSKYLVTLEKFDFQFEPLNSCVNETSMMLDLKKRFRLILSLVD
jgi:hypothetical protein